MRREDYEATHDPAKRQREVEQVAADRRTVWLSEPIVDPVTGRRVLAYDPENCPEWLAEILAEQP